MKALSIRQPWAWLIVNGFKPLENRDWWTGFRGEFLIHAGKAMDDMSLAEIVDYYEVPGVDPDKVELPRGGIVGRAKMVDCVSRSDSRWFHGKFGFVLEQARPLTFWPCPGRLGFFEVPLINRDGDDTRQRPLF